MKAASELTVPKISDEDANLENGLNIIFFGSNSMSKVTRVRQVAKAVLDKGINANDHPNAWQLYMHILFSVKKEKEAFEAAGEYLAALKGDRIAAIRESSAWILGNKEYNEGRFENAVYWIDFCIKGTQDKEYRLSYKALQDKAKERAEIEKELVSSSEVASESKSKNSKSKSKSRKKKSNVDVVENENKVEKKIKAMKI